MFKFEMSGVSLLYPKAKMTILLWLSQRSVDLQVLGNPNPE